MADCIRETGLCHTGAVAIKRYFVLGAEKGISNKPLLWQTFQHEAEQKRVFRMHKPRGAF